MAITVSAIVNELEIKPWSDPLKVIQLCKDLLEFAREHKRVDVKNYYCLSNVIEKLEIMKFINEDDVIVVLRCYEFAKSSGYQTSIKFS